jgi:hypothetical protein
MSGVVIDTQLVASRFVVLSGGAVDLATGDRVLLKIGSAGGPSDQMEWALRCDALHKLQRRSKSRLIDFGATGEHQRFEAWSTGPVRDGGARSEYAALDVTRIERRSITALAELFDDTTGCRPRVVSLFGPPGAGKTTAIGELARVARMNGLVPVSAALLASPLADVLAGRTLFVIDDDSEGRGWSALLAWTMRSPRPHVLLFAGVDDVRCTHAVGLEPVPVDALVQAVTFADGGPALAHRVRRAAERANGLPGRFVEALWRRGSRRRAMRFTAHQSGRPNTRRYTATARIHRWCPRRMPARCERGRRQASWPGCVGGWLRQRGC